MNERDSEALNAMLLGAGHVPVSSENDADLLIFNTCSVREQAERKAIGKIGIIKRLKRKRPEIFIGVMGCMAQRLGEKLIKDIPHIDFVVGTDQLHCIPEIIDEEIKKRHKDVRTDTNNKISSDMSSHNISIGENRVSAYIAIMRGCNRFCSYCIVPYVRGREKSRPSDEIVREAKELTKLGVKEINLLGQNVAAYGMDGKAPPPPQNFSPFAELLDKLSQINDLKRIRFISPHPAYFNDALIEKIAEKSKICNNIHLPLQSGSDRILKAMNRPYTSKKYLEIIRKLRNLAPDITFSTDIIVGFPGESEEDFKATEKIMREVGYNNAYIFKYSSREGTKAHDLEDDVPQKIKDERNQILLKILSERNSNANKKLIDKKVEVLIEGRSKRAPERMSGKTEHGRTVIFHEGEKLNPGKIISVTIEKSSASSLYAESL